MKNKATFKIDPQSKNTPHRDKVHKNKSIIYRNFDSTKFFFAQIA